MIPRATARERAPPSVHDGTADLAGTVVHLFVIPANAGIHLWACITMDSRFSGNDEHLSGCTIRAEHHRGMRHYHASWVLPVTSAPVPGGTVIEHGGRIVYVGPRRPAADPEDDVDLGAALLMPGLVNAHCHLELTAMRGFLDGLSFREWILRLTMSRRAVLTPGMLLDSARLGVVEGLLHGVTTFADTGDTGAGFDAMLESGVRGICYREVFGPDPAQCAESLADLERSAFTMRERETALVRVGVSPHAPYTVSDDLFRATATFAREHGFPLAVHIAESAVETALVVHANGAFADGLRARGFTVEPRGRTPIGLLESLGVLDVKPLLIHCVQVDSADIATIASHDAAVAHCPASNAKLGHGTAPLSALRRAGIRVGLGTDSVASNDRMDLLDEARVATLFANASEARHDALSARDAFALATIGGARALGIDREVGSLEVGKAADLAAFRVPDHRAPLHDPIASAIYALAGVPALLVTVAGVEKVREGRLIHADAGLSQRVQQCAGLLQAWLASMNTR
ncbi:TRZ/ATZ family hydrolase [soil metagenome]